MLKIYNLIVNKKKLKKNLKKFILKEKEKVVKN